MDAGEPPIRPPQSSLPPTVRFPGFVGKLAKSLIVAVATTLRRRVGVPLKIFLCLKRQRRSRPVNFIVGSDETDNVASLLNSREDQIGKLREAIAAQEALLDPFNYSFAAT